MRAVGIALYVGKRTKCATEYMKCLLALLTCIKEDSFSNSGRGFKIAPTSFLERPMQYTSEDTMAPSHAQG